MCMDHTMLDVTGIPESARGPTRCDGEGPRPPTVPAWLAGTIPYEILPRERNPEADRYEERKQNRFSVALEGFGTRVYRMVEDLGNVFMFLLQCVGWLFRPPSEIKNIVKQME